MILKLGTLEVSLSGIDLLLSLNAVPSVRLLAEEQFDARIIKEIVSSGERANLQWEGGSLEILPYGFDRSRNEANESEAYVHALLLKESLESWFTTKVEADPRLNYGVYQNGSDAGGWTFLNSCLGHNFLVPASAYKERIDQVLPIATCLIRPVRQDNQQHLSSVVNDLQHHFPELLGWTVVHADQEALRFVFMDEDNAFKLDETWENLSANLPVRFVSKQPGGAELRKTGLQVSAGKKMAFLQELAQHGIQTPLGGFLEVGSESELVYLPGPVKMGERLLFCKTVTYSFDADVDALAVTLSLTSGVQTPASTAVSCRLEGAFKAWDADDEEEVRVRLSPPDDATWQMMDRKDSSLLDPGADLLAKFVLPTTPSDTYAGLYVRRTEGDRLVFESQSFHTPVIYGSHQVFQEKLEAATLSLNTEILALSVSDSGTNIADANGIVMDEDKMMSRAGSNIFAETETVILNNNVHVKQDALDVKSKTDVANNVKINGTLDVGGL